MWYYNLNNQPTGPVDDATIKTLIQSGTVTPTTLVWQEGMANWQTMGTTALAVIAPAPAPAPAPQAAPMYPPPGGYPAAPMAYPAAPMGYAPAPTPGYYGGMVKPAAMQMKEMNDLFMWFWICLVGSIVTFGVSAIASMVIFYIIIYRCWGLIQDGYARTTPGKAIGFTFIPFYNFYWIFQAFAGLSKDMNMFIARRNLPIQRNNEGMSTAFTVLTLCNEIPYVDFLTVIPWFVLWIIMTKNFKDTALALIQYTQH
jgi:hypothetical protein